MPTQMLDWGYPQTMLQNVVYAMPPHGVALVTCVDAATAVFQTCNDVGFGTPFATTLGSGGATVARQFIRCTNQNAVVNITRNA